MKVREIEEILARVSPDAELVHVWVKSRKNPPGSPVNFTTFHTTLYFMEDGVKTSVRLDHKIIQRTPNSEEHNETPSENHNNRPAQWGDKFKELFRRTDGTADTLQKNVHREDSTVENLGNGQHI